MECRAVNRKKLLNHLCLREKDKRTNKTLKKKRSLLFSRALIERFYLLRALRVDKQKAAVCVECVDIQKALSKHLNRAWYSILNRKSTEAMSINNT